MFLALQGCVFAFPARAVVGPPPPDLQAEEVTFPSGSGSVLRAWLIQGKPGGGAVLLLHGMGDNRRNMLSRARFLSARGFTVLAPDFQAEGESPGEHITFGALESLDAQAAIDYLRLRRPGERVGIVGISMGGAAALVGDNPLPVDALVLESVYSTIRAAVANRLNVWLGPLGFVGHAAAPWLLSMVGGEIGLDREKMRPVDAIARVEKPVLVMAGTNDRYTPIAETRELYIHARAPKEIWEVPGAGHVDLHDFAPAEYEHRVGQFLSKYLRGTGDLTGGGLQDWSPTKGEREDRTREKQQR